MSIETPKDQFTAFNLDPALAEMVETAPPGQLLEGILRLEDPASAPPSFRVVSQFNRICTGRFPAEQTWGIRQHPNVISLKAARPLGIHQENGNLADLELPRQTGAQSNLTTPFTGRGCIVAALDFGLDFAHPNFLNPDGTTRLVAFWHQGATYNPAHPNRFGYGRVYSREDINAALRASDPYQALGYHPAISDTGEGSHGTHTLDIAAGNGRAGGSRAGVGADADLGFVHLSTPRLGVVGDLGDSVRVLEALDFVDRTARGRPWVVNLSVGRTAGSHDGTSLVEQGMHELLRLGPGRAIVQSAGNYRSADLAVEGWIRDGEYRDMEWIIDPADTTANEIDAWYSGKDRFVIAIRPPDGGDFVEVKLGEVADLKHNGDLVGRIYHRKNDPNNRDNHVEVFLYPGAPPGTWTVRLIGDYVISGRFHAWIERDLARPGAQSRFDAIITSQQYTLGTIATSPLVITVGAYDANAEETPLAPFSSCGPTRDERRDKPELLAPGVDVVAARSIPRGAVRQEGLLIARSGTSMAAPHVTGTVAAIFEAAGRPVSIDEIRDCLERSAEPVADCEHAACCAWGRLNTAGAIREIRGLKEVGRVPEPPERVLLLESPPTTFEPAGSNHAPAYFASASEEPQIHVPLDEGELMNGAAVDRFLERAEHALRSSYGGRRESETSFLQRLLREVGTNISAAGLSPAELLRAVLNQRPLMQDMWNALEVLAIPSQQPDGALRAGDWMLRAVPGTGDVGHVSVLASDDLLTQSMLASEGIAAESTRPGYYGLVIEAGAFPHNRVRPFARRLLDSRGCVPPNTVFLRPEVVQSGAAIPTPEVALPLGQGGWEDIEASPLATLPPARPTTVARVGFQPDVSVLCPPPPVILDQFDFDADRPKAAHRARIGTLAQEIVDSQTSADPIHTLCILGHTDNVGGEAYNRDLGARRAIAVANELESALETRRPGLAATLGLSVESRGEEAPLVPNTSAATRARNRRVEIFLNRRWLGATPAVGACPSVAIGPDPTTPTPFAVGEDTFSATIPLLGASIPVSGTVFYPAESAGSGTPFATALATRAPLVVFAHGNHATFRHPTDRFRESCGPGSGFVPLENHRGYEYLQRLLAGMGMVAVSVDANVTNCTGLSPTNIHLRGALILAAVQHFLNLHTSGTSRFVGRLDLGRTALLGHSRGGEAVLVAAETLPTVASLSAARVLGVLSLAPTDAGASSGRPNGFAYLAMLPAADGDVIDNDGAKFYDQATPSPFKCQIYLHGANHNFFNRNWPLDEGHGAARLSRAEHERILSAYACAFFRGLLLGHNTLRFLRVDVLPPGVPTDKVLVSFEATGVTTIDDHENRNISLNALGAPTTQSAGLTAAEFDFQQGVLSSFNGSFFGKTVGMVAQTSAAGGLFRSQLPASVNLRSREVWVRTAEVYNGAAVPSVGTGYQIGLEDAAGGTSFADSNDVGGLPRPFDRRADDLARVGADRTKTMLKSQRFAAACFTRSGFDLSQVRAVLLRLDRGDGRALAFDQLQIV